MVASAAAVFTLNLAKAAPILLCQDLLASSHGQARVIVTNSGCANACTGPQGMDDAREMGQLAATALGCPVDQALVASTGVIGVNLKMDRLRAGIPKGAAELKADGGALAAQAIMTTDPFPKDYAVEVRTDVGTFRVGGMAKGSGMIEPRMATMLGYLTTDAAVDPSTLYRALTDACRYTFNAITVDGEPSTNDCVFALANGRSGVVIRRQLRRALRVRAVRGSRSASSRGTVRPAGAITVLRGNDSAPGWRRALQFPARRRWRSTARSELPPFVAAAADRRKFLLDAMRIWDADPVRPGPSVRRAGTEGRIIWPARISDQVGLRRRRIARQRCGCAISEKSPSTLTIEPMQNFSILDRRSPGSC